MASTFCNVIYCFPFCCPYKNCPKKFPISYTSKFVYIVGVYIGKSGFDWQHSQCFPNFPF